MAAPKHSGPPGRAKLTLLAQGLTLTSFAKFHGTSRRWVSTVLNGHAPAPDGFRRDLSEFLQVPEQDLFRSGGDRG